MIMINVTINATLLVCLGILIKRKLDDLKKFSRKAGRIEGEKANARIKVYQLPKYFFTMKK